MCSCPSRSSSNVTLPTGPSDPSPDLISKVPPEALAPTLRVGRHFSPVGWCVGLRRAGLVHSYLTTRLWGSKCSVNICLIEFGQGASSRQSPRQQDSLPRAGKSLGQKGVHRGLGCLTKTGRPRLPGGSLHPETGTLGNPGLCTAFFSLVTEILNSRPRRSPAIITKAGSAPPCRQSPRGSPAGYGAPAPRPSHPSPQTPQHPHHLLREKNIEPGTYHNRSRSILISCSKCFQKNLLSARPVTENCEPLGPGPRPPGPSPSFQPRPQVGAPAARGRLLPAPLGGRPRLSASPAGLLAPAPHGRLFFLGGGATRHPRQPLPTSRARGHPLLPAPRPSGAPSQHLPGPWSPPVHLAGIPTLVPPTPAGHPFRCSPASPAQADP